MNNIDSILREINEIKNSTYLFCHAKIMQCEKTFLKARLYFKEELFIQFIVTIHITQQILF